MGTYSPADWVHLLAARFSLQAEQLRQRTPPAMRFPLSLTVAPVDVVRSGALLVAAGFARSCPLAPDITLVRRRVCLLHPGVWWVDSAPARVALLDTDLLPPPLSLVTVALLPLNVLLFSSVCVLMVGRVSNTCSNWR